MVNEEVDIGDVDFDFEEVVFQFFVVYCIVQIFSCERIDCENIVFMKIFFIF